MIVWNPDMIVVDLVITDASKRFELAGRIATAIGEIRKAKGSLIPQDLNEMGFSSREVIDQWDMAHGLIAIETRLMEGKSIHGCKITEIPYPSNSI